MAISTRVLYPRQAEAGKIKIGRLGGASRKKQRGDGTYRSPEKLNHFIITKTLREGNGRQGEDNFILDIELMKQLEPFLDKDGKLRRIPVMFDSDIIEEVFVTRLASYTGRSLSCAGDGQKAVRLHVVGNKTERRDIECPCERLATRECKPNGTLWVTIMAGEETRIGVRHAFRTTSWNSIRAIEAGLKAIQRTVGTICGFRCWLIFEEKLTKTREGEWRRVPTVHVELRTEDIMSLQQRAIAAGLTRQKVTQIAGAPVRLALPGPGDHETAEEQAAVADEFYPEGEAEAEEYDDGEEVEEIDPHNPETGEVYDDFYNQPPDGERKTGSHKAVDEKPSRRATEPGVPAAGKGEPEQRDLGLDEYVRPDDPLSSALAEKLRLVARLRGFDPTDEAVTKQGMKEIVAEETKLLFGEAVTFKFLRRGQMQSILRTLSGWIEARARRDAEDDDDPDDDIPG